MYSTAVWIPTTEGLFTTQGKARLLWHQLKTGSHNDIKQAHLGHQQLETYLQHELKHGPLDINKWKPRSKEVWNGQVDTSNWRLVRSIRQSTAAWIPTTKNCSNLIHTNRPASWSSGQSLWPIIMRSRVRFPVLTWEFSLKRRIPAVTMVWVG